MKTRPLFALIWKDLRIHFSDTRAIMLTLAVPIVISSFFGFIMGGVSGQPKKIKVACRIVTAETNGLTAKIVSQLKTNETFEISESSESEARSDVLGGKISVAVIFPPGFGDQAARGFFRGGLAKPELLVLGDPSHSMEVEMTKGLLMQQIMQVVSEEIFSGKSGGKLVHETLDILESSPMPDSDRDALKSMLTGVERWITRPNPTNSGAEPMGGMGRGMNVPFSTRTETLRKKEGATYNGYSQAFGGMTLQFVLMAAIESGIAILMERQRGIWRRLRAAPVSRFTLLAARGLSCAAIVLLTLTICWIFSMSLFHVRVNGSWAGFIAINLGVSLFTASFGLFIAALGRTPEAARGMSIFAVLILVMLGGAWMPSFLFPAWLQKTTLLLPTRWAVDGFAAMTWRGLDMLAGFKAAGVLLAYAAALSAIAFKTFRWEMD
jgi:ABC-2 type transport system permease protein